MNELIQISSALVGENESETVNARELHAFLGIGRDFSNWVKFRIDQYGFVEGEDYVVAENLSSPDLASSKSRAQQIIEYHLTLDMAKELAMLENNDKGRDVRKYFIACEKQLTANLRLQNQQMQAMLPSVERMLELEALRDDPKLKHFSDKGVARLVSVFRTEAKEANEAAVKAINASNAKKYKASQEVEKAQAKREKTRDDLRLALIIAADYRDLLAKVLGAKVIPTTAGNEFLRLQMAHTTLTYAHKGLRPVDDYGFRRINEDVLLRMAEHLQAEDDAVFVS